MKWHVALCGTRALGVLLLLMVSTAQAEEGPVLPGLDSLPLAPEVVAPRSRKSAPSQPGWRGARGAASSAKIAPAVSEVRDETKDDWRSVATPPSVAPGNQQKLRNDAASKARNEKPARQERLDPERRASDARRAAAGAAAAPHGSRQDQGDLRAMQRGAPAARAEPQRPPGTFKREAPRSPRADMGRANAPQNPQPRRAAMKAPQSNGLKPPQRSEKTAVRRPAR